VSSGDRPQKRGFPGSVGPHERKRFAWLELQVYTSDGMQKAVPDVELMHVQQTHAALPR
jgi:hypothetical protein